MPLQYRRKESRAGQRDPMYNPERDLAHVGIGLTRAAMSALEEQFLEPWFKEFMEQHNLTESDFVQAARPFANAVNRIIATSNPPEALEESGFTQLSPAVQVAIYCKLGQVLLAAIWSGVKDVSRPDSDPPLDVLELLDDVQEMVSRFEIR